jgi:glycosyltransferase involved in cell wall biosynthesis
VGHADAANRPLRVGLNLLFLGDRAGGVGRYARELSAALLAAEPATALTIFLSADAPKDLTGERWARRARVIRVPRPTSSRLVSLGQYAALPALAAALRLDVLHSPANTGPVITPRVASVVSLMDLIWLHHAEEWDPDPRVQRAMRRLVGHSVRHANRVLAISHAAAADIAAELGVAPERIAVTPLGVRIGDAAPAPAADIRRRLELGNARVLLCIAQKRPYKNQERLVRALAALPGDVVAVMPGARTPYEERLRAIAAEIGVADRTRFPDWVSEAELAALYQLSAGFVLPSLTEGFGLPVLEAMARGLPVACADIPALREVAGDAAVRFAPADQAAVDAALRRLLDEPGLAVRLAKAGRERATRFTWLETGRGTLRAYRAAIGVHV